MIVIIYDVLDYILLTSILRINTSLIIFQMGILQNRVFMIMDCQKYKFTIVNNSLLEIN